MMTATHHTIGKLSSRKTLQKVKEDTNILFKWISNNYMVANPDKCYLQMSSTSA